ncbi:uncharacterized protein LOC114290224 [Camellia sinensis]|uniref:uncharacterized protein LOC114290224 n=1 Tax=Camellia sinensis TaxID=4442 RepID=UPI001035F65F|nr:uncharacterized protein LOC114290224 [Camellia sinensis]
MVGNVWIGWYIWKDRNNLVFNHHPIEPSSTLYRARVAKEEFDSATAPGAVRQHQSLLDCLSRVAGWQAPSTGSFKINCDVAIKMGSHSASTAVLLRDDRGNLIDGDTQRWRVSSSLQGKALACRSACQLEVACNLNSVEIEGDNKDVISLCVSEDAPPWECGAIFKDIKRLATQGHFSFHWSPRTANKAAHWVAQASLYGRLPLNWVGQPPAALALLLNAS